LKDFLRKEITDYKIPEVAAEVQEEKRRKSPSKSFWKEAYGLVGLKY